MKKLFMIIIFVLTITSAFAQTIVWKELTSLPEGYYLGDAVSLNNDIYFVAGRTDAAKVPFLYKLNGSFTQRIKGE